MEEIPNIYEWNDPYDILNLFDTKIYGDKHGIMYVTSASEQMLLFKISGRYVLPSKKDIVKYLENGAWAIKEEPSWMIG